MLSSSRCPLREATGAIDHDRLSAGPCTTRAAERGRIWLAECPLVSDDDDNGWLLNNPAGRVMVFLRDFQEVAAQLGRQNSAMAVMMRMLGEEQESTRIYLTTLQMRIQAESVPGLMQPYAGEVGYRAFVRNYPQVLDAAKRLEFPHQTNADGVFTTLDEPGWSALEYASEVLNRSAPEPVLTPNVEAEHLTRVRSIIDAVAFDEALSPTDRARIVDLLRKAERALIDIHLYGALPVQEAAAAAGAIVRATSIWERVKSRPWVRDLGAFVLGAALLVDGAANVLAIEQYFSDRTSQVAAIEPRAEENGQAAQPREDEVSAPPGR